MSNGLEITVNRRRFDHSDGVGLEMTAAQIAALVGIPAQNAVVERETAKNELELLEHTTAMKIAGGMHFLVTRHFVMGG